MHDESADGNDFFKCDFCLRGWDESRPMVEGHRGSLICSPCLTIAYTELVLAGAGEGPEVGRECRLCLQTNEIPHWVSPIVPPESLTMDGPGAICRECVERCARQLEKDPDLDWRRPA